ncbi:2-C-methyl-D-erythritol 4-phosphate cytidylyltransferase [Eubacterium ventriosum]|jgi:2-C-methyl-D-erythritol 4-phosphate cytidylyltransferase|uniref:2-C-methyl-D-erythritol 4-phosphate cytidylyltransferase n=1 Tax=Eubacterium ventriosum TaxID=39496 RepID=A0A413RAV5_9FIRM|nr:2-C-methyl-D-erythritol 4-phosphate cytidylyltransferase [Eubacterium ventriosum]RHA19648.1 2-C-methyl-D-erythritol 4-phosphate cytidylyltransferase [Eubacterium ventriosum]RHB17157.1 2-C-methyl-D-erythritol 4-phosphate cytidylyltransferase [Eubacterium ventriosum]
MNKITAIVLAAGSGSRMKNKTKKQFMEIKGKPVIWYSLFEFEKSRVDEIILVTGKEDIDYCKKEIVEKYNLKKIKNVVAGGSERYESVYNGLKEVTGNIVLIHDGARPLINNEIIERSIEGTIKSDACVVGVPVKDTIKRADKEGYIIDTPNRSELWITQTPQSFKTDLVKMAYKKMKEELEKGNTTLNITDDAMVVEEFTTNQVRFVQGDYKNIKVTTPEDIDIAELFIELDAK